ncbi:MAG TPA: MarR family transcriptional regulator [Sphingobium sp.]
MTLPYYTTDNFRPRTSAGYLLKRVYRLVHMGIEGSWEEGALSFTQWVVLAYLCSGTVSTAAELSREIGHDAGAMTRIIDQLEARGMLTRERDTEDRRIVKLLIAAEGRTALDTLTPRVMDFWNDLFSGFDAAEIDAFIRMLTALQLRLDPDAGGR